MVTRVKLNLVVAVGSLALEDWQSSIVEQIRQLDSIQSLKLYHSSVGHMHDGRADRRKVNRLLSVYRTLDRRIFKSRRKNPREIDSHWLDASSGEPGHLVDAVDLILNLTSHSLPDRMHQASRLGELTLRIGGRGFDSVDAGFYEVFGRRSSATIELIHYRNSVRNVVQRSFSAVDPTSITRFIDHAATNGAVVVAKYLNKISLGTERTSRTGCIAEFSMENQTVPSLLESIFYILLHIGSFVRRRISSQFLREKWHIAFQIGSSAPLRYLEMPSDRFWADPFPFDDGDRFHIFFEEKLKSETRGTIQVATLDLHGNLIEIRPALVRPYHLSYPLVFEHDGEMFMIPETGENNRVEVYKAKAFPHVWELYHTMMEGIKSADCTIFHHDGLWWMFLGRDYLGRQMGNEVLELHYSESPFGPWTGHPENPIKVDVTNARGAGKVFVEGGRLMRPAQDCSGFYGRAANINEITELSRTAFLEKAVDRLTPFWDPTAIGLHTYNKHRRIATVDVLIKSFGV